MNMKWKMNMDRDRDRDRDINIGICHYTVKANFEQTNGTNFISVTVAPIQDIMTVQCTVPQVY